MKVLFLTIDDGKRPSTRYRVLKYIPLLELKGISCKVMLGTTNIKNLFRKLYNIYFSDIIVIQKKILKKFIFRIFLLLNKNIIYDFDDAVYAKESFREKVVNKDFGTDKTIKRLHYVLKKSRYIIAGNNHLKRYALKYNKNICVIPSSIKFSEYSKKKSKQNKNIYIGWIGLGPNTFYLHQLKSVLTYICKVKKNVKLLVISDIKFKMDNVSVVNYRWNEKKELTLLHKIDIGIMPLIDDEWSKGKSAFKIIQYMAAGIPVVASPVGANVEIVKNNFNGYLAADESGWKKYLLLLIKDKSKREQLGDNGRRYIEKYYSIESNVNKLTAVFDAVKKMK